MVSGKKNVSKYLSYLLRHAPESIGLEMDNHGWVSVDQLIDRLNAGGKYEISLKDIRNIVANDAKGRFRLDEGFKRIKACQGHTIAWVEPELTIAAPPHFLYHGTTVKALEKIEACGFISRMQRHAVHMQAELEPAWLRPSGGMQSRWCSRSILRGCTRTVFPLVYRIMESVHGAGAGGIHSRKDI